MTFLAFFAYILIGIVAGLLGGLLGISGGVITVPCLTLIFYLLGFAQENIVHLAIGTSLAAMIFTGIATTLAHQEKKGVLWDIIWKMMPGIFLGCIIGALIARGSSETILEILFGVFAFCVGIYFLKPSREKKLRDHRTLTKIKCNFIGLFIGSIATILGIGGGILTVPILVYFGVQEKKAIGSSAASGMFITILGAIFYLYFGLNQVNRSDTIGYIYLPAFFVIGISTLFTSKIGANLAHNLKTSKLRLIFAIAMILIGIAMVI